MRFAISMLAIMFIAIIDQITLQFFSIVAQPFYLDKSYLSIWSNIWLPWNLTTESFIFPLIFSLTKGTVFTFTYYLFVKNVRKEAFHSIKFALVLILLSVMLPFFLFLMLFSLPFRFILLLSFQQAFTCIASVFVLKKVVG